MFQEVIREYNKHIELIMKHVDENCPIACHLYGLYELIKLNPSFFYVALLGSALQDWKQKYEVST